MGITVKMYYIDIKLIFKSSQLAPLNFSLLFLIFLKFSILTKSSSIIEDVDN